MTALPSRSRFTAAVVLISAVSGSAQAQRQGENLVQLGFFSIDTQDRSRPVHTDLRPSTTLALTGQASGFDSPGTAITVSSANTVAFALAHFFTDHLALKFEGGIPPTFAASGRGVVQASGVAGATTRVDLGDPAYNPLATARQWSPVLSAQYSFFAPHATVRPFLGIGVTYAWSTDVRINPGFQDALNSTIGPMLALAAGKPEPTRVSAQAGDGWAPTFGTGLAFRMADHWGVSGGLSFVPLHSYARLQIRAADDTVLSGSRTRISVDPLVYSLLFNYRFTL